MSIPMKHNPSEVVQISPEHMHIANVFMKTMDIKATAEELETTPDKIGDIIAVPSVKNYIDVMFIETGYRNKFKIGGLLDELIEAKISEMMQNDTTSKKDIADLIALAMKFRKEFMEELIRYEEIKNKINIKNQVNVINNGTTDGTNYAELLGNLMKGKQPAARVIDPDED